MDARFRVRTRSEGELRPRSLQEFQDLVHRGEITRDDLVHDALTGEWAPAWAHPVYQLVTDPLVTVGATATEDMVFVESKQQMRTQWLEAPPAPAPEPVPEARTAPEARPAPAPPAPRASGGAIVRFPLRVPERRERRGPWWQRGLGLALAVAAALAATATVARPAFRWAAVLPGAQASQSAPREARPVSVTEATLRLQAWDGFVERVDARRVELGVLDVPTIWLDGRYLAEPTRYREVRTFWHRYLRFVETVHEREDELYKAAYLEALDRADVAGPMRSLRLATALADFQALRAAREIIYAQAWELATASLGLDELLSGAGASVRYEPARSERLSADPVLEAASPDHEMQERMERALDRVMVALHDGAPGARGSREAIPHRVVVGLRDLAAEEKPRGQ